jgi:hypothetical protein
VGELFCPAARRLLQSGVIGLKVIVLESAFSPSVTPEDLTLTTGDLQVIGTAVYATIKSDTGSAPTTDFTVTVTSLSTSDESTEQLLVYAPTKSPTTATSAPSQSPTPAPTVSWS